MPTYSCNGVVIKQSKFNDSDRLVKLLTQHQGLVDVIVKGARKITSKKGGSMDLLNHVSAEIAKGKSLDILTDVVTINDYLGIKKDLFKVGIVYYLVEVLVSYEYDNQECGLIFERLLITLDRIEKSKSMLTSVLVLKSFELYYLDIIGYKMQSKDLGRTQQLFEVLASNSLESLAKLKYNTEIVKELSDSIQNYTETVLERKFRKVNLLAI